MWLQHINICKFIHSITDTFFFSKIFTYLFILREGGAEREAEGESQAVFSVSTQPDAGLDLTTMRS